MLELGVEWWSLIGTVAQIKFPYREIFGYRIWENIFAYLFFISRGFENMCAYLFFTFGGFEKRCAYLFFTFGACENTCAYLFFISKPKLPTLENNQILLSFKKSNKKWVFGRSQKMNSREVVLTDCSSGSLCTSNQIRKVAWGNF